MTDTNITDQLAQLAQLVELNRASLDIRLMGPLARISASTSRGFGEGKIEIAIPVPLPVDDSGRLLLIQPTQDAEGNWTVDAQALLAYLAPAAQQVADTVSNLVWRGGPPAPGGNGDGYAEAESGGYEVDWDAPPVEYEEPPRQVAPPPPPPPPVKTPQVATGGGQDERVDGRGLRAGETYTSAPTYIKDGREWGNLAQYMRVDEKGKLQFYPEINGAPGQHQIRWDSTSFLPTLYATNKQDGGWHKALAEIINKWSQDRAAAFAAGQYVKLNRPAVVRVRTGGWNYARNANDKLYLPCFFEGLESPGEG